MTYENLRYGNITPTDFDGVIDYHGKAMVVIEIKYRDAELPYGQRLALQNAVNGWSDGCKDAVAFVVQHNVDDVDTDIDAAKCTVREIYYHRHWTTPKERVTLKEKLDSYIKFIDENPLPWE